jgi:hypothetical protein
LFRRVSVCVCVPGLWQLSCVDADADVEVEAVDATFFLFPVLRARGGAAWRSARTQAGDVLVQIPREGAMTAGGREKVREMRVKMDGERWGGMERWRR